MSNYRMTLIVGGREINIPVLPAKLNVSSPGKNERVTVLDLGEILLLRKKGLRILSWESFFPADSAPYTTGQVRDPIPVKYWASGPQKPFSRKASRVLLEFFYEFLQFSLDFFITGFMPPVSPPQTVTARAAPWG